MPRGRGPHESREGSTSATSRAAEMFIVTGHNPERVRSEAAFARLCGVAPIPASSGMTTRRRLNRGGHRIAKVALYRIVIVPVQHHEPTKGLRRARNARGQDEARYHPLPQATARPRTRGRDAPHPTSPQEVRHDNLTAKGASTPSSRALGLARRSSSWTDADGRTRRELANAIFEYLEISTTASAGTPRSDG